VGLLFSAGLATAGTKVQGNVVPATGGNPSVSAKSKFKMSGAGAYQVGLKGITDAMGNPAAVTTGTTPDTQYFAIIKGDAAGVLWQYNVPFNIEKEGQAKLKGSVALITTVAVGTAVGVLGVEVHEPTTALDAAACTAILTDPLLPGVYLPSMAVPTNPCASGARIGLSGVVTEAP
jgi:hypothetical protein